MRSMVNLLLWIIVAVGQWNRVCLGFLLDRVDLIVIRFIHKRMLEVQYILRGHNGPV